MIDITLEDAMTNLLDQLVGGYDTMRQSLVRDESDAVTPFIQQLTPVGRHFDFSGTERAGGQLRDSLHFVVGEFGSYLAGASYGRMVITGTAPHSIGPRVARSLAFFWEREGYGVLTQHVNHPGTKPNDFRQTGLQEAIDSMAVENVANDRLAAWMNGGG